MIGCRRATETCNEFSMNKELSREYNLLSAHDDRDNLRADDRVVRILTDPEIEI